jgi:hypothetical protein
MLSKFVVNLPFEVEGESEREKRKWGGGGGGGSDRHYFLTGEHKFRYAATKVPRQCPLVLLEKGR